jgi:hypothetical protein
VEQQEPEDQTTATSDVLQNTEDVLTPSKPNKLVIEEIEDGEENEIIEVNINNQNMPKSSIFSSTVENGI